MKSKAIPDHLIRGLAIEVDYLAAYFQLLDRGSADLDTLIDATLALTHFGFGDEDVGLEVGLRVGVIEGTANGLGIMHASPHRERRDRRVVNGEIAVMHTEIGMVNTEIGARERRDQGP